MGKKNDKHYEETDIKEFIKRLKEEICCEVLLCNCELAEDRAKEIIDKLAGDKLIEGKK